MDKGNKMDDQHIVTSFDEDLKDLIVKQLQFKKESH